MESVSAVKSHRKRGREECLADDASVHTEDEERPAKRPRLETAEAARMSVESEVDSASEASVAGSESEEDMQVHDKLISDDEAAQDLDGVYADYVYHPEHDSACGHDAPRPYRDGLSAPCNSPADDEETNDDNEEVDEEEEEEEDEDDEDDDDDAPRKNTEQEADNISNMYDEAQNAEISDDEEDAHGDDDNDVDEFSPEAVRARRLAREVSAVAANIYYETRRGVALA